MHWFKNLFKSKDEEFKEKYPFLIMSPRVPMEEEIGISKEEVLLNYNKFILGDLCNELKKLGFKQRGKTQEYYKILNYNVVARINIHRNIKSFSIFSIVCGFTLLCEPLDYWGYSYHKNFTNFMGIPEYDFDCKDEVAAKQSYDFIMIILNSKVLPLINRLNSFESFYNLFYQHGWTSPLCLCLREGKIEEANKLIKIVKNKSRNSEKHLYVYEELIKKGKESCIEAMLEIEEKNKKKYKIK